MKTSYPPVTIITVNFNGKKYLKRLFDSLYKLEYPKNKIKVILVDNVSTDKSVEMVRKNYPRVKILLNDVNNYCKACNIGIRASTTQLVALVNNDARADKRWLAELVRVITADEKIAAVGGKVLTLEGRIQNAGHYELPNFYWGERGAGSDKKKFNSVEEVPSLCGAAVLYRKNALLEAGLFDEDFIIYGEDVDICLRLLQNKYKLMFAPASVIYHKFHGTSDNETSRYYIERNRLLYLAKHFPQKLNDALLGSGKFTVKNSVESLGKIYPLIPEVILKLIKTHPLDEVKDTLRGMFKEIRRISNLENDILVEKFNAMALDQKKANAELSHQHELLNQQKDQFREQEKKLLVDREKALAEKIIQIQNLDEEVKVLREKEKRARQEKDKIIAERMPQIKEKEELIADRTLQINSLREELEKSCRKEKAAKISGEQKTQAYKEEIKALSEELSRRLQEVFDRDKQLVDRRGEIEYLKTELSGLAQKLADNLVALEESKNFLAGSQNDILAHKEELINLSKQLRQRMDEVLVKEGDLAQAREQQAAQTVRLQELESQLLQKMEEAASREAQKMEEIASRDAQLTDKENRNCLLDTELRNLATQLRQRLDEALVKDGQLIESGVQIASLNNELVALSQQLCQRMEEAASKDRQLKDQAIKFQTALLDKENKIASLSMAVTAREVHLAQQENKFNYLLCAKDSQLKEKEDKFNAVIADKENQLTDKNNQLADKENKICALNATVCAKDSQLKDQENKFNSLVQEKDGQLKEKEGQFSAAIADKENQLLEKDNHLAEKENRIGSLNSELSGIYRSEGFRFILRPLWTLLWNFRRMNGEAAKRAAQVFWFGVSAVLTPLYLALGFCFLAENAAGFICGPLLRRLAPKRKIKSIKDSKITLVMPNYNGVAYLKECLPSIYAADGFSDGQNEVLIVDDGSRDGSVDYVRKNFPQVRLILNGRNRGFGFTCNRGIKAAKNEIIVLINNDIILTKDFLHPLLSHLQRNEDIFTVTPKLYGWDRQTFAWGMHMGHFENGYIRLWNESEIGSGDKVSQAAPTIFAIGGSMVFRKQDFLWLGGFDAVYRPNCWEDIDISYRAWKRGLKVIYEPGSLMYHKGRATLTYERPKEIKNELLFTWKNMTDKQILKEHLNLLPWNLYRHRGAFFKGFFWALNHLPQALLHRFLERGHIVELQDKKIFDKIMLYYGNFIKRGLSHPSGEKPNILIVSRFLPYPLTMGGRIRIHNLVKSLSHRYNFSLLSLIDHRDELVYLPVLREIFTEVYPVYAKSPLGLDFSAQKYYPEQYKQGYSYSQELADKLKEIRQTKPLDLIHIESNELLYLVDYCGCLPIVYTEHDISILSLGKSYYKKDSQFFWPLIDNLKRIYFHNMQSHKLDRVITLSREDESILKGFFPKNNITLVPTGVDMEHFSLNTKPRKGKKLVFVGHYRHFPNEDAVVYFVRKIFPLIRKEIPEVELLMVGSHPTPNVERLTEEENVTLVGQVQDVKPFLDEAAVFVNSIRLSAGIKGKVLEAMASGVPVVSTMVGSSGIDATSGEEILIADTPKEFARQVIRLFKDQELRSSIIANARQLVENKYGWFKSTTKLDNIYKGLLFDAGYENPSLYLADKAAEKVNSFVDRRIDLLGEVGKPQQGPEELHLELTYNCNSKCIMCDLWDHNRRAPDCGKELSLDEIKSFVDQSHLLQNSKVVVLSGGEPFLRNDIVEMGGYFSRQLPQSSLGILTNGIDTELILNKSKDILQRHQPRSLWLGSSLDGIGKEHDKIRGTEGAFAGLCRTISRVKKELPGVKFSVTFTLTPYNVDQLLPAKAFADCEGLDFFAQFVVPKAARGEFIWKPQDLERADKEIMQIVQGILAKIGPQGIASPDKIRDKYLISQLYYWSHLVKYQTNPQRFFKKCVAGSKFAMLNPYGDCYFCPGHKNSTIGNVREQKFDNLWNSQKAQSMRSFIEDGNCHCWLVCTVFPVLEKALK